MIYYGNVREDGRVIQPHELVYDDCILDCIDKVLYMDGKKISLEFDDEPLSFLIGENNVIFVDFADYTKVYKASKFGVKIDKIGLIKESVKVKDSILTYTDNGRLIKWDYSDCKQIIITVRLIESRRKYIYVNHNGEVNLHPSYVYRVLHFIIMNVEDQRICFYDTKTGVVFNLENNIKVDEIENMLETITDIKIYTDNIEIYTTGKNYCTSNEGDLMELPDGWTVKPVFNRCKSARKKTY